MKIGLIPILTKANIPTPLRPILIFFPLITSNRYSVLHNLKEPYDRASAPLTSNPTTTTQAIRPSHKDNFHEEILLRDNL